MVVLMFESNDDNWTVTPEGCIPAVMYGANFTSKYGYEGWTTTVQVVHMKGTGKSRCYITRNRNLHAVNLTELSRGGRKVKENVNSVLGMSRLMRLARHNNWLLNTWYYDTKTNSLEIIKAQEVVG